VIRLAGRTKLGVKAIEKIDKGIVLLVGRDLRRQRSGHVGAE
jgi:hypothetical protein